MAVKTVTAAINGVSVNLSLDESTGKYVGTLTAPSATSWGQEENKYGITVTAEDTAGNTASKDRNDSTLGSKLVIRVKETTAPTAEILSPSGGAYVTNAKKEITFRLRDSGSGINISSLKLKIDSGSELTSTSAGMVCTAVTGGYDCTYTPQTALSEGAHTVTVNVSDNDDNAASAASSTFTVDTVPPTLNILQPANNLITKTAALTVSGTTSDDTSKLKQIEVFLNDTSIGLADMTSGSWSKSAVLTEGVNTIKVVATDNSGLTTTVTRTVTLDTQAPVITDVALSASTVNTGKTFTITVTVTD